MPGLSCRGIVLILLTFHTGQAAAQFSVTGQLMLRAEGRHGYGKLIEENQEAAFAIGQRARIQAQYDHEKVKFLVSAQDVRIWGSTPQVKETDNLLSVHEAFADLVLYKSWRMKLGRQELNYDNGRFLGNLDWALQARAHDFALIKFEKENLKVHFGAGYNQVREALSRQPYTIPNQYKTAQMIRMERQADKFALSVLFWNNGVEENDQGNLKVRYTQTLGLPAISYTTGKVLFSGYYYFQAGADTTDKKVSAHNVNGHITWKPWTNDEKGKAFKATVGFELLTGTSQQSTDNINRSFNPFYGTNHAHNGYMDFFYIGNRHINSVGLRDLFLRLRYDFSVRFFVSLNGHQFYAANEVVDNAETLASRLGFEADLSAGFILNEIVSLQGGYSQVWQTRTLEHLQRVNNPASAQNWGYVAILVRPNMKNRFVGLQF